MYASNCPVSRPVTLNISEDDSFGGLSWNNKQGLFFAPDNDFLPMKPPAFLSYKPIVGG